MEINNIVKIISIASGGIIGFFYGGWSPLLNLLLAAVVFDYLTGFIASFMEGRSGRGNGLNSSIGFVGIARKVCIFIIVAVAHVVDKSIGSDVIMTATIFFYLANELLSILENAGRIGLPIPGALSTAIEVLKRKGEAK